MLDLLNTSDSRSNNRRMIERLIQFCETYLWRDLTFISLDTQKDWKMFVDSSRSFEKQHAKYVHMFSDILLFDDEGLFTSDEQDGKSTDGLVTIHSTRQQSSRSQAYCKMSVGIIILNLYIYRLEDSFNKALADAKAKEGEQDGRQAATQFRQHMSKATRFVKYSMLMYELAAKSKQRRKEVVYRCHFDFVFIVYLSVLQSMIERLQTTQPADSSMLKIVMQEYTTVATYLLVLVEVSNSSDRLFVLLAKMKLQSFQV